MFWSCCGRSRCGASSLYTLQIQDTDWRVCHWLSSLSKYSTVFTPKNPNSTNKVLDRIILWTVSRENTIPGSHLTALIQVHTTCLTTLVSQNHSYRVWCYWDTASEILRLCSILNMIMFTVQNSSPNILGLSFRQYQHFFRPWRVTARVSFHRLTRNTQCLLPCTWIRSWQRECLT